MCEARTGHRPRVSAGRRVWRFSFGGGGSRSHPPPPQPTLRGLLAAGVGPVSAPGPLCRPVAGGKAAAVPGGGWVGGSASRCRGGRGPSSGAVRWAACGKGPCQEEEEEEEDEA